MPPTSSSLVDHELSESHYFETNAPPSSLPVHSSAATEFITQHVSQNRRVVLVSSGGTTVPLENQTVRFIDNFSAGTRGATSAEYFLEAGYAVIFLHRQFSLLPYSRHYSHSTNCFLDYLEEAYTTTTTIPTITHEGQKRVVADKEEIQKSDPRIQVPQQYRTPMLTVLRKYRRAKAHNLLLLLPFTTITSYLFTLREIAMCMRPLGDMAMFYLAAAVSDFFVPPSRMVEHKIQSGEIPKEVLEKRTREKEEREAAKVVVKKDDEVAVSASGGTKETAQPKLQPGAGQKLVVDLDPVPKFLKKLVEAWAPDAMIISFKLETDPSLLLYKCRQSLDRYSHHLVIGNLLSTRKHEVVFVDRQGEQWLRLHSHPHSAQSPTTTSNKPLQKTGKEQQQKEEEEEEEEEEEHQQPIVEGEEDEIEGIIIPQCIRRHEELMMKKSVERVALGRSGGGDAVPVADGGK